MERLDDLHDEAVMFDPVPAIPACSNSASGADAVDVKEDHGSRVTIGVRLACPAMIVVSDTYFPGWRAYVDGHSTEIYSVNGAMRGVLAPAGAHLVAMRYRPMRVYAGAALSLLGILGAAMLARTKRL